MEGCFTLRNNQYGVLALYNTSKKIYSTGLVKLKKTSFGTIKGRVGKNTKNGNSTLEDLFKYHEKHLKEKKEKIMDLALNNNHWEYFVTLTFDDKEFKNGYSHEEALKLLRKFIDNQQHQNKGMSYLMVSEFHKSGRLHFHGLFANVPKWKLKEARYPKSNRLIKENGKQIYNLTNYKLGYTTVSEVESQEKVSNYISKYISKELMNLKFKKSFWYSRDLEKPKMDYEYNVLDLKEKYTENVRYSNDFIRNDSKIEVLHYTEMSSDTSRSKKTEKC